MTTNFKSKVLEKSNNKNIKKSFKNKSKPLNKKYEYEGGENHIV